MREIRGDMLHKKFYKIDEFIEEQRDIEITQIKLTVKDPKEQADAIRSCKARLEKWRESLHKLSKMAKARGQYWEDKSLKKMNKLPELTPPMVHVRRFFVHGNGEVEMRLSKMEVKFWKEPAHANS